MDYVDVVCVILKLFNTSILCGHGPRLNNWNTMPGFSVYLTGISVVLDSVVLALFNILIVLICVDYFTTLSVGAPDAYAEDTKTN